MCPTRTFLAVVLFFVLESATMEISLVGLLAIQHNCSVSLNQCETAAAELLHPYVVHASQMIAPALPAFPPPTIADVEGCVVWPISAGLPSWVQSWRVKPIRDFRIVRENVLITAANAPNLLRLVLSESLFVHMKGRNSARTWVEAVAFGSIPIPCEDEADCARCLVDDFCAVGFDRDVLSDVLRAVVFHGNAPEIDRVEHDVSDLLQLRKRVVNLRQHLASASIARYMLKVLGRERASTVLVAELGKPPRGHMFGTAVVGLAEAGVRVYVPLESGSINCFRAREPCFHPLNTTIYSTATRFRNIRSKKVNDLLHSLATAFFDAAIFVVEHSATNVADDLLLLAAFDFFPPSAIGIIDDSGDPVDSHLCTRATTFLTSLHKQSESVT